MKKYEEQDEDYYCFMVQKMLQQWNMCGHSVSMDCEYFGPKIFILLKEKGHYTRGTVRSDSNFFPKFIHFSKSCGEKYATVKFAVNERYSMVMTA